MEWIVISTMREIELVPQHRPTHMTGPEELVLALLTNCTGVVLPQSAVPITACVRAAAAAAAARTPHYQRPSRSTSNSSSSSSSSSSTLCLEKHHSTPVPQMALAADLPSLSGYSSYPRYLLFIVVGSFRVQNSNTVIHA